MARVQHDDSWIAERRRKDAERWPPAEWAETFILTPRGGKRVRPEEIILQACEAQFGLVVLSRDSQGIKQLRAARTTLGKSEPATQDLVILGPDENDMVWVVKRSAVRRFMAATDGDGVDAGE
jgi:hypothetical protein